MEPSLGIFDAPVPRGKTRRFFAMAAVIYHTIVQNLRGGHRNAVVGIMLTIAHGITLVVVFYGMFTLIGVRGSPVRGDFLLYIMSGVFLFLTHIAAVSAVQGGGSTVVSMMQHAPMNAMVGIIASAMTVLYQQFVTITIVLSIYHILITPITIDQPGPALYMFIMAWFSGCVVGLLFLALGPWLPRFTSIALQLYRRLNMISIAA